MDLLFDLGSLEADLLAAGETAPDFRLPDLAGKTVDLSAVCRRHPAVILSFWYVGCAGCRSAFPQLQRLYNDYRGAGLEVLAINRGDDVQAIREYLTERGLAFPVLRSEGEGTVNPGRAYGVLGYPTHYLLDSRRQVVWRRVGYRDADLREALATLGF